MVMLGDLSMYVFDSTSSLKYPETIASFDHHQDSVCAAYMRMQSPRSYGCYVPDRLLVDTRMLIHLGVLVTS
jgi:hypothetical protein